MSEPAYPKADVSSPHGHYVSIKKATRKVTVRGVDYGPNLSFHGENTQHLVLKVGGHTGWCGRGQTAYYPGRFAVFEIKSRREEKDTIEYSVEPLVDFTQKQY